MHRGKFRPTSGQVVPKSTKPKRRSDPRKHCVHAKGRIDAPVEVERPKRGPRPDLTEHFTHAAGAQVSGHVHGKIHEAERDNVGVEAAHKVERAAEDTIRTGARLADHIRSHPRTTPTTHATLATPTKPPSPRVEQFRTKPRSTAQSTSRARQTGNKPRQTSARTQRTPTNPRQATPASRRLWQKKRLKMRFQRRVQTAKRAAAHGKIGAKGGGSLLKRAGLAILKVKKGKLFLLGGMILLLVLIVQACMGLAVTISNTTAGVMVASSYLAGDADIDDAALVYSRWETELRLQIMDAPQNFPGFDEYRYSVDEISHNPFELMAYLTAAYGDFTFGEVEGVLLELFNTQYSLSFVPEVEIRTRTETRTDDSGNTYTITVEYEWHILNINLVSQSFMAVVFDRMDEVQLDHFRLLMLTMGNRQHIDSPFDFGWLPFVSSHYGYRIHPIRGGMARHFGIDIALPTGTEMRAGHDGTVTVAGDAGGYGLMVELNNGEGLVTRYAHCSALLVRVGQTVEMGDVIALVGSTGDSTGPHLHLEIIKNGRHLNPLFFALTNHHLMWPSGEAGSAMTPEQFAALYAEARSHLGKPYVYGANGPNAFDCSSFVCWVFTHSGVYHLPRTTAQGIYNQSRTVPWGMQAPGDIVFFHSTYSTTDTITHVGIYLGGGQMIHAGRPVNITSINTPFWQRHFHSFGRLNWN